MFASAAYVGRNVYARRVVILLVAAAATLTMADYVFKAEITAHVDSDDLGSYFATIYFVINVISLFVQVFVVGWLVKRLGVGPSLCVLPFCLAMGATGILAGIGIYAAIALKGMDLGLFYIPTQAHLLEDMQPRINDIEASLKALGIPIELPTPP